MNNKTALKIISIFFIVGLAWLWVSFIKTGCFNLGRATAWNNICDDKAKYTLLALTALMTLPTIELVLAKMREKRKRN